MSKILEDNELIYMKNRLRTIIWTGILCIFVFHGVLEDLIPIGKIFDECMALSGFPLLFFLYMKKGES